MQWLRAPRRGCHAGALPHASTFVSIRIEANARDDARHDAAAFNTLAAEMDSTGPGGKRTG
ncbi:hypothetical protein DF027_05180 [Burkholderia cenocepacia]|nr:hypothetical protein DF028_01930 [Burkholderia cenocepacia]RQV49809.1 hypothetical protein DF027_05180 [Burkholderia cenocepacia]RQV83711.1 hypothetical protein DF010_01930 [Burkholderia cenocepacia]